MIESVTIRESEELSFSGYFEFPLERAIRQSKKRGCKQW